MKNLIFGISIWSSILFTSCECMQESDGRIVYINNNSNHEISCYVTRNYPDTLLPASDKGLFFIKESQRQDLIVKVDHRKCKEYYTDEIVGIVFFIDTDTLSQYSWEEIREQNKIIKRIEYSTKSLNDMNWIINYP